MKSFRFILFAYFMVFMYLSDAQFAPAVENTSETANSTTTVNNTAQPSVNSTDSSSTTNLVTGIFGSNEDKNSTTTTNIPSNGNSINAFSLLGVLTVAMIYQF